MIVKSLFLENYRNYVEQKVNFCDSVNIIVGENAMGKTNLLEGIYYFSHGRSFKSNTNENISFKKDFSNLTMEFFAEGRDQIGEILFTKGKQKKIKVNGVELKKTSELLGRFICILFTPDELSLVKSSPEMRRKFIDSAIIPLRPNFVRLLSTYNLCIKQKNAILRDEKYSMLPIWNEKIAETGSKICSMRESYINRLYKSAKDIQKDISLNREELEIRHFLSGSLDKEEFYKKLCENEKREKEAKISLIGPHRDDIMFNINSASAKKYASQGQQRSIVLSLKIAQMGIIEEEAGEKAVLLLDDVMSELDKSRRQFLTERITNSQVIISCTDIENMGLKSGANILKVKNGVVE